MKCNECKKWKLKEVEIDIMMEKIKKIECFLKKIGTFEEFMVNQDEKKEVELVDTSKIVVKQENDSEKDSEDENDENDENSLDENYLMRSSDNESCDESSWSYNEEFEESFEIVETNKKKIESINKRLWFDKSEQRVDVVS